MGLFGRRRHRELGQPGRVDGPAMSIDLAAVRAHFGGFVASRRGVEAFVEPATNVSACSVVLVAALRWGSDGRDASTTWLSSVPSATRSAAIRSDAVSR